MFITTSRNADNLQKKTSKLFEIFFSDIKHIPRGTTPLKKLLERSFYNGYVNFFIISKSKDGLYLSVFTLKDKQYLLKNKYKLASLSTQTKLPLSTIKKTSKTEKPEIKELFENTKTDNKIKIEKKGADIFFLFENNPIGFSFSFKKS